MRRFTGSPRVEKSDHRHRRLLRARRERPCGATAEQCDEVASSHEIARRGRSLPKGSVVRHSKVKALMTAVGHLRRIVMFKAVTACAL